MAIPSNFVCLSSSPATALELGHCLFLKISPSQRVHTLLPWPGVILYAVLTSAPSAHCLCLVQSPQRLAAVLPIACLQEYMVRGKINREHCSCMGYFTYVLHSPTNLLPVDIPYPCQGEGNPWTYLPLCPVTVQPTSDVKKFRLKQSGSYHVNKVAFFGLCKRDADGSIAIRYSIPSPPPAIPNTTLFHLCKLFCSCHFVQAALSYLETP